MDRSAPYPFQFGLRTLFSSTAGIAALLGAWVYGGFLAAVASLPVILLAAMLAVELVSLLVGSLYKRLFDPV